jgi:hypothetical protein
VPSAPVFISGNDSICSRTTNTYSVPPVNLATSYIWTLPSGWSGTSNTVSITATASNSTGIVGVAAHNSFGTSGTRIFVVHVTHPDTLTTINGDTITSNATPSTTTYQWIDCNNANQPIAGETNRSYTPSLSGYYAVIVTRNGCIDTSMCINVVVLGIEEINFFASITIAPNPFNSETTITFSEAQKNTTIKVTDIVGKEIKTMNFTGRQLVIDKEEMKAGIYFVQTIDERKNVTNNKIIIQ